MTDIITFSPVVALDANGLPVANAEATFFASGTTTPVTVYQDKEETTPHASPLVADGNGYFPAVFRSGSAIKAVVKTPLGATLYTVDPATKVPSSGAAASTISFSATPTIPVTNVQAAIEHVDGTKANRASPALTGTPTAPTPATATDNTRLATTAYVRLQVLDEDDFASDDPARPASQQSIAAYIAALLDSKYYESGPIDIVPGGPVTLSHGLGEEPKNISLVLECVGAERGYTVGERVFVDLNNTSSSDSRMTRVKITSSSIFLRFSSNGSPFVLSEDTTGDAVALSSLSNWKLYVRAFA